MAANVLRVNDGKLDARYVVGKDFFTIYSKGFNPLPVKFNNGLVGKSMLETFLQKALSKGKHPVAGLAHKTNKNTFTWDSNGVTRYNSTKGTTERLRPASPFTLKVARILVMKNVG